MRSMHFILITFFLLMVTRSYASNCSIAHNYITRSNVVYANISASCSQRSPTLILDMISDIFDQAGRDPRQGIETATHGAFYKTPGLLRISAPLGELESNATFIPDALNPKRFQYSFYIRFLGEMAKEFQTILLASNPKKTEYESYTHHELRIERGNQIGQIYCNTPKASETPIDCSLFSTEYYDTLAQPILK